MEAGYQARSRWKSDATVSRLGDYLTWPDLDRPPSPGRMAIATLDIRLTSQPQSVSRRLA